MPLFQKKPVQIEARRYIVGMNHGRELPARDVFDVMAGSRDDAAEIENAEDIQNWLSAGGADFECVNDAVDGPCILINTLEGQMKAAPGSWIIKGVKGEFYPCKPDIFAATYEPVS